MSLANEDVTVTLDQLAELHAVATPGPWAHNPVNGIHTRGGTCVALSHSHDDNRRRADAALIVAAVNALPGLLAAIRAAYGLHTPIDRGTGPQCQGCATHVTFTPWPCATVRALDEALEVPGE